MSEELAARLMARIAVPPMPFAPDTYTAGRMDQFTEMITQLRALPEVDKEQVLADVKARIEDLHYGDDNLLIGTGYQLAVNDALAVLTQPQTEKCPQCGGDGKGPLTHHFGEPCPTCDGGGAATEKCPEYGVCGYEIVDGLCSKHHTAGCLDFSTGGGAATAAGARGADLEARIEALAKDWETWDGMRHERYISELRALIEPQSEEPGPYAKAFRERVCPVPEFPGIKNRQEDQA